MGFYGVNMRADDFGRLGELLRRGGMWRGKRLLDPYFMQQAISPTRTNGCYGWLIWLNAARPCIGPRITERPATDARDFPDLPADMYRFSGLFGQLVTVFPSQDIVLVRTGQDRGLIFSGGEDWEGELYRRVLGSITDQRIKPPGPAPKIGPSDNPNADAGFQNALTEPDQYGQGANPGPLPPAGPARARALRPRLGRARVSRKGVVSVRMACAIRWPAKLAPALQGHRPHAGRAAQPPLLDQGRLHAHGEAAAHGAAPAEAAPREADDAAGVGAQRRRHRGHLRARARDDQAPAQAEEAPSPLSGR